MSSRRRRPRARGGRAGETRSETKSGWDAPPWIPPLACLAVFAAAFLAHFPTLRYEFLTSWDDPTYVADNPWIRGFTRENLVHVFTQPYFANFLPLHLVSYMVDYSLWGLEPFGYHLQSVLLDAVNAVLALVVVRRLFGSMLLAFVASLLFAVHPSHVEAVAWISIRKDLLATAFLLLTVYFYHRAAGARPLRRVPYAASVVCFTLGLLSKVSIVTLPLFLLLLDYFRTPSKRRVSWKEALVTKVPYGLIGAWLVHLNSQAQVKAQAAYAHDPLRYLMVKGHAVWNYLALLTGLPASRPVYDTPELAPGVLPAVVNLAGLVVLPAAFWAAHRRGLRAAALGVGWIFVMLLPALLFPLVTYMADRYLYAPSLGFCWMVAAGVLALSRREPAAVWRPAAALLIAIPFALFTYRTLEYSRAWSSSEALWTYAITRSKDYRVHNNMAQVRLNQKRFNEAERLYRRATEIENIVSYQGLATVYYNTRRYGEAEHAIDRAFQVVARKGADADDLAELHFTRGAIYWVQSRNQEAIAEWEAALRANPRHEGARQWLGTARGQPAPAP